MKERSIETLIDELSRSDAYPSDDVTGVEVRQTHISVVFLAGDRAYKIKKPVDFGFVDYSTLEDRRRFCEAEVELNRRLAPDVYLGTRAIVEADDGRLRFSADGEEAADAVEWAVEMVRLDERDHFEARVSRDTLEPAWIDELGEQIARFHAAADRGSEVTESATFDVVERNALDNFSQSRDQVGVTVSSSVATALAARTRSELERLRPLIESRIERQMPCDTHGDLRLEHIYRVDDELLVVDCIEFNDAFRYSDPIEDIAFLVMDLRFRWRDELAERFTDAYFRHSSDPDGRALLDFYVAYRSAVRAKVHGMAAVEPEQPEADRRRARERSRGHWNFAWSALAEPRERPVLLLLVGLPGTGKSTLARHLKSEHDFFVFDSDVVRKELAGLEPESSAKANVSEGIYTPESTTRTYAECLERALARVDEGQRVAVEATFRDEGWRERFLVEARARGVPAWIIECQLPREIALERLDARRASVSDADRDVYDHIERNWDPPGEFTRSRWHAVSTISSKASRRQIDEILRRRGLA